MKQKEITPKGSKGIICSSLTDALNKIKELKQVKVSRCDQRSDSNVRIDMNDNVDESDEIESSRPKRPEEVEQNLSESSVGPCEYISSSSDVLKAHKAVVPELPEYLQCDLVTSTPEDLKKQTDGRHEDITYLCDKLVILSRCKKISLKCMKRSYMA